ncbi:discoidin domain-containing protein [Bacteroides salyersiae]|nr:discoidin domain-containing protein [Bacteroides salyersiae]
MPASESSVPLEATTNMGTYQTYNIKNVIDGNYSTKFWSSSAQKIGDYIQLDFGASAARFDITLHFADGDMPTGEGSYPVIRQCSRLDYGKIVHRFGHIQ